MAHTNSPLGQLGIIVPVPGDLPDVVTDLTALTTSVEKKIVQTWPSRPARNAGISSPVDGMMTYIQDVDELDSRVNGSWVKIWPIFYSGPSAPSSLVGADGDFYVQTS